MESQFWNERYRSRQRPAEDFATEPTPLLVKFTQTLPPGEALDLACGTGRNALWLAEHGWEVSAVDASQAAIEILQSRAEAKGLKINALVADLEKGEFEIEPSRWDLVAMCYYLQRNLLNRPNAASRPAASSFRLSTSPSQVKTRARIAFALASWKDILRAGRSFTATRENQTTPRITTPSPRS